MQRPRVVHRGRDAGGLQRLLHPLAVFHDAIAFVESIIADHEFLLAAYSHHSVKELQIHHDVVGVAKGEKAKLLNMRIEFSVKLAGTESWEERIERAEGEVDGIRGMKKDVWKRVWDVLEQERKRIIGHEAEDEERPRLLLLKEGL